MQLQTRRLCKLLKVQHGIATFSVEYQILTPVDAYAESQLVEHRAPSPAFSLAGHRREAPFGSAAAKALALWFGTK